MPEKQERKRDLQSPIEISTRSLLQVNIGQHKREARREHYERENAGDRDCRKETALILKFHVQRPPVEVCHASVLESLLLLLDWNEGGDVKNETGSQEHGQQHDFAKEFEVPASWGYGLVNSNEHERGCPKNANPQLDFVFRDNDVVEKGMSDRDESLNCQARKRHAQERTAELDEEFQKGQKFGFEEQRTVRLDGEDHHDQSQHDEETIVDGDVVKEIGWGVMEAVQWVLVMGYQ